MFHCDEVMATTMLLYTKEYANAAIVRTRNDQLLDQLDIICDVGSIYDPERKRFDHHQRSFNVTWDWPAKKEKVKVQTEQQSPEEPLKRKYEEIKLSSAGLIYKHYGKEVL